MDRWVYCKDFVGLVYGVEYVIVDVDCWLL